ncbi:MAG: Crp/Fnr family transcriptional regulator [Proteobacteria bacterium]|nr:Crp/Fnr family transcriptional regulator [Pseudomonadota bacterium]
MTEMRQLRIPPSLARCTATELTRAPCKNCGVCADSAFGALAPAELKMVKAERRSCVVRRGTTLFNQGDEPQGIYCLRSGHVLLTQTDVAGNETGLRLVMSGELIGFRSFFAEEPHAATARVLTPSRVCLIPGAVLWKVLERNAALARALLRLVARDQGPMQAPFLRGPWLSVRERLVHLLLIIRDRCAETLPDGRLLFDLPLTRREIATMVGVRPESISRAVHDLRAEEIATFNGHRIIASLDRLVAAAKTDRPH